jgi:uncharacterized protein
MKNLHMISFILVVVGAVNWGLIGLLNLNLVTMLFGASSLLTQIVYVLVGLAGVYLASTHMNDCKVCKM